MSTVDILHRLGDIEEAPWGDLYGEGLKPRKLAQLLSEFDASPVSVRTATGIHKGYRREDLWDAWQRYTPTQAEVADPVAEVPAHSGQIGYIGYIGYNGDEGAPPEPAEPSEGATVHDGEQFPKPATVCTVCGQSLFPADIAEGADRHAGCIPSGWAS